MNEKFRIVLEDNLLPAQVFFNAIPDRSFVETLKGFKQGIGAGFNDAFCGFPGEEEYDEEVKIGIEFAIKGEEIVVAYDEFYSILLKVCDVYIYNRPEQKKIVTELLTGIREKLNTL